MTLLALYWSIMIACYLLASRLRKYAEKFKFVDKLMSLSVYALVLLMGLRMGADEEVTSSPVAYPDPSVLERSEAFEELGIEATQTMNDLWLSVKTEGANTTLYLALTLAAIAAVVAFFLISAAVTRRRKAKRCRKWREAE